MSMIDWVALNDVFIRLIFFFSIFALIVIWEIFRPRKDLNESKSIRWISNLSLVALNSLIVRILLPVTSIGVAVLAHTEQWGLLNLIELPGWLAVIIAVVLMDFAIYLQHLLMHAAPFLWRLHQVHHADLDVDVTTGLRFHPLEILISMLFKFVVIAALGVPVVAVVIFEVLLNASSMFNHGNIFIPSQMDRALRHVLVTPDMHRLHHSVNPRWRNRNFGFCLTWWDRIFGTYLTQPFDVHDDIKLGLKTEDQSKTSIRLIGMLLMPFKKANERSL